MERLCIALLGLWIAGCSEFSGISGSNSGTNDSTTPNKPSTGDDRPSEDGEGVPGYLTNPSAVVIHQNGGTWEIVAPAGTIQSIENGSTALDILGFTLPEQEASTIAVTQHARVLVQQDGSVTAIIAEPPPFVVLSVVETDAMASTTLTIPTTAPAQPQHAITNTRGTSAPAALSSESLDALIAASGNPTNSTDPGPAQLYDIPGCNPPDATEFDEWTTFVLSNETEATDEAVEQVQEIVEQITEGDATLSRCIVDPTNSEIAIIELTDVESGDVVPFPITISTIPTQSP